MDLWGTADRASLGDSVVGNSRQRYPWRLSYGEQLREASWEIQLWGTADKGTLGDSDKLNSLNSSGTLGDSVAQIGDRGALGDSAVASSRQRRSGRFSFGEQLCQIEFRDIAFALTPGENPMRLLQPLPNHSQNTSMP